MFFSRNLCLVRNSESCYLISVLFNGIVGPTKYWLGHFLYNQTHFNFFSLALKKIGTVGIWIPETFKNRTLWCPFFKLWDLALVPTIWKLIKMNGSYLDQIVRFSNGWAIPIVLTILNLNILNCSNLFDFQIIGLFGLKMAF